MPYLVTRALPSGRWVDYTLAGVLTRRYRMAMLHRIEVGADATACGLPPKDPLMWTKAGTVQRSTQTVYPIPPAECCPACFPLVHPRAWSCRCGCSGFGFSALTVINADTDVVEAFCSGCAANRKTVPS